MTRGDPFITFDEAMARMISVNLRDYPTSEGSYSMIELLEAYYIEAQEKEEKQPVVQLSSNGGTATNVCKHRLLFAEYLLAELQAEIDKKVESNIQIKPVRGKPPKLFVPHLAYWCEYHYGIYVPEWYTAVEGSYEDDTGVLWSDIMIRIYDENTIGFLSRSNARRVRPATVHFTEVNLWDRNTKKPNHQGKVLLDLLEQHKAAPSGSLPTIKKSVSLLKKSLQMLTGVWRDDPFEWSKGVGWRAKFFLEDRRGDRDKRADNSHPYEDEKMDEADEWMMKNRWIYTP